MKVYVVNYKGTTTNNGVKDVESGICDYGYFNEEEAIKKVSELAAQAKNECIKELGWNEGDIEIVKNENEDCQRIYCGSYTYEYWVSNLIVED